MSTNDTTDDGEDVDAQEAAGGEVSLSVSTLGNTSAMDKAAETTQLDERRIATDVGHGIQPPYNPETLAAFQELNETHQACVRKKSRYEVGYGFDIVPHSQADDPDPDGEDYETVEEFWRSPQSRWQIGPEGTAAATSEEVLELARQDYHGVGWAALEILVNGEGDPVGLAHVPATTVRVRKTTTTVDTEDGEEKEVIQSGHGYVQIRQGRRRYYGEAGDRYGDDKRFVDKDTGDVAESADALKTEPANELIFMPNPSPLSLYYGIPDWVPAMQTMGADQAAMEWNHDVFDNLGIPYYVVKVTGGTLTQDSEDDLREMMDNLKGSRYRTAVLEVEEFQRKRDLQGEDGNDIEISLEPLGAGEDLDMEFQAFRERNEHEIAKVHEVPPILINVTSTSNRSNSKEQVREFAEDVVAPEQKKFEARLYTILHQTALGVSDWTIQFDLRGADRPEKNARVANQRVNAAGRAVTVDEAREEAGFGPLPDDHPVDGDTLLVNLDGQQGEEAVEPPVEAQLPPEENKAGERADLGIDAEKDPIEQTQFNSSNLYEGLYDFETRELFLSFKREGGQNSVYAYVDVPASVWESLTSASSAGSYHYENIRLNYGYIEITNHHDRLPAGPSPGAGDIPDDIPLSAARGDSQDFSGWRKTPDGVPDDAHSISDESECDGTVHEGPRGGLYCSPDDGDDDDDSPEERREEIREEVEELVEDGDTEAIESMISDSVGVDDVNVPVGLPDDQLVEFTTTLSHAGELGLASEVERVETHSSDEAGFYRFNDGTLSFNWELDENDHLDYDDGGEAVGDDIEWLVTHELGHAEHDAAVDDMVGSEEFFDRNLAVGRDGEWVGYERVDLVDDEVSSYATTNPAEFVSEVFSGLATGEEFSDDVMEIYEEFDGPDSWQDYRGDQE